MLKRKKNAFTLMEMIIVLSIIVIVLGITTSMFIMGNKVFSDSNVKFTLQMEGQDIQERIINIGMQAISIDYCNTKDGDIKDKKFGSDEVTPYRCDIYGNHSVSGEWIDISELGINSPSKDSEYDSSNNFITHLNSIQINFNDQSSSLLIGVGNPISTHVKSFRIRPANINDNAATIGEANSIEFNIELDLDKDVGTPAYPINFTITFRNKQN